MKALEDAIYGALSADATLGALLSATTAIYPDRAPKIATFPLIVYTLQPQSTDEYVFGARAYEMLDYLIKAIDRGFDTTKATDIAERIDALLTNSASFAVTGYTVGMIHRLGRINYPEDNDAGDHYNHRGGIWRVMLDPN